MYAEIPKTIRIDRFTFGTSRIDGVVYEHEISVVK